MGRPSVKPIIVGAPENGYFTASRGAGWGESDAPLSRGAACTDLCFGVRLLGQLCDAIGQIGNIHRLA